jgi:hypothetical protein
MQVYQNHTGAAAALASGGTNHINEDDLNTLDYQYTPDGAPGGNNPKMRPIFASRNQMVSTFGPYNRPLSGFNHH